MSDQNVDSFMYFMNEYRVTKNNTNNDCKQWTHVTKPFKNFHAGTYYISFNDVDKFYTYYCNALNKTKYLSVAEKPGCFGPLRVDFDFISKIHNGKQRHYTERHIKEIVKFYQECISDICYNTSDDLLYCIVLEKKEPRCENDTMKDGFHLHFPNFICESKVQDEILRNKVTSLMKTSKLWTTTKYDTPVVDMIDKDMGKKVWMMYGSMNYKSDLSTPYMYSRPQGGEKDPWKNCKDIYGHAYDKNQTEIKLIDIFADEMNGRQKSIKYYLPRFLSIRGYNESVKLKKSITDILTISQVKKQKVRTAKIATTRRIEDILEDIKIIKDGEIMEMINHNRADNYNEWIDLGWTLFNIGQGHDETLRMWIEFSQQSYKFKQGECEEKWNCMELRDKSLGSLLMIAKQDNPERYRLWKDTNITSFLYKSIYEAVPTEYDVAMVVCSMFKDRFCCVDAKKDTWYEFREHRWRVMDDGLELRKILVDDVLQKYLEFKVDLARKQVGVNDSDLAKYQLYEKRALTICTKLKTIGFHDKVIRMCKLNMHDSKFLKKMDENKKIVVCENGVLDLDIGVFREGRPDDYATFSTCIHYQKYDHGYEEVKEVRTFLKKVFPNENRRKYFMDIATSCLQGGNVHKRFLIGTGSGDNSKSVTYTLLEMVFGEYYGKFPRELLISGQSGSSSGARPELAHVRGKRIMSTQEITHKDNLNIGVLKELTGNDSFFTRGLFEKGREIRPQYTLWMQCNEPPKIPGHDSATWSRIRVLDFESKFVKPQDRSSFPVPKKFTEQMQMKRFEADPSFMDKLPGMAPVILWMLFDNYNNSYKQNGLIEPKEVMSATDQYKESNDVFIEFVNEKVTKSDGNDDDKYPDVFILLAALFEEFKEWYSENYPSYKNKIGKNAFRDSMKTLLGVTKTNTRGFKSGKFYGYTQKEDSD